MRLGLVSPSKLVGREVAELSQMRRVTQKECLSARYAERSERGDGEVSDSELESSECDRRRVEEPAGVEGS